MTNIALFIEGCDPKVDTLDSFSGANTDLDKNAESIRYYLGLGMVVTQGGGPSPHVLIVPLNHRDGGVSAGEFLELDQMIQLWELYCELHGLPSKSADDLLADLTHLDRETQEVEVINWISGFIEGWDVCTEKAA